MIAGHISAGDPWFLVATFEKMQFLYVLNQIYVATYCEAKARQNV